ncbi:unnamed protein product [Pleuronectes platessa]|uniref:WW domain binding protein VOPP1 n=1 Tax=Pleuronectes platessa TaxID=8262 RepID=A0A9N7YXL5_PLEPL|nr:unnamed protein product [Pleuronectes platessa]
MSIIRPRLDLDQCVGAKKYCWYFEGGYPIYFICRSYEDCCGTRCCVRALSIQRLWYFWVLLMMGVLFCCGAGFFIRRRMYPSPLRDDPAFNVSFTRHPATSPGTVRLKRCEVKVQMEAGEIHRCGPRDICV